MVRTSRVVAGLAGLVLVVSGLIVPSGASALPVTSDPPIASVEPSPPDDKVTPAPDDSGTTAEPEQSVPASADTSPEVVVNPTDPADSGDPSASADPVTPSVKPVPSPPAVTPPGTGPPATSSPVPIQPLANGQLSRIDVTVAEDGAIGKPNPAVILPSMGEVKVNGEVLDDSNSNGVVATQDRVAFSIQVTPAPSVQDGDTLSLVGTLPNGVIWLPGSYSSSSCNVAEGTGGHDLTSQFTCNWKHNGMTTVTFTWFAYVASPPMAGSTPEAPVDFVATFTDGHNSAVRGNSTPLRVVAVPASALAVRGSNSTVDENFNYGGQVGFRITHRFQVQTASAYSSNPDVRGYEAPQTPFSFSVKVPSKVLFIGVEGESSVAPEQKTRASQAGGKGGDINVTVNKSISRPTDAVIHGGTRDNDGRYASVSLQYFVPYTELTPGDTYAVTSQAVAFDPYGLSGRSNYGDGLAPGQATAECVTADTAPNDNCASSSMRIEVANAVVLYQVMAIDRAVGDTSRLYGSTASSGNMVLAGQPFAVSAIARNEPSASAPMTDAGLCMTWETELGDSGLKLAELQGEIRVTGGGSGPVSDRYILEYASVPGLTPGPGFVCGKAGTGTSDGPDGVVEWVTNPATDLNGGWASVNAVRLMIKPDVAPGIGYELRLPMVRSTDPLPFGTPIRFYSSWSANETPTSATASYRDRSTAATASDAMVRASTVVDRTTAAAVDRVMFTVTPTVIGPPIDATTTATNTTIQLSFNSACVDISEALEVLRDRGEAEGFTVSSTPGATSANACALGTGLGPVITLTFGDVAARGSSAPTWLTSSSVPGNETRLLDSPIEIPVTFRPQTPSNIMVRMKTLASSTTDGTASYSSSTSNCSTDANGSMGTSDYRTTCAQVRMNTATGFSVAKQVVSDDTGSVAPGEHFSYRVAMLNTEQDDLGVASFVDVLPFSGDPPNDDPRIVAPIVNGLAGGRRLTVTGVEASMVDGNGAPVAVKTYCSSHNPAAIYASLATDSTGGPIPGTFGWQECGSDLSSTTAVRFVTEAGFVSFAMLTGRIHVKAPGTSLGGTLANDVSYHVEPGASGSVKEGVAGAASALLEAGAAMTELTGTVRRDLNFNSTIDTPGVGSDQWWPAGATLRLLTFAGAPVLDPSNVPYTAVIEADGAFTFPSIPAGDYKLALATADAPTATWRVVAPTGEVSLPPEGGTADVLYQEIVAAPVLVDDSATTKAGIPVVITVLANDTVDKADVPGSVIPPGAEVVTIASQPQLGTVSVDPSGQVTYSPVGVWTGKDEFTYSWTNVYGVMATATVTVYIAGPPTLTVADPATVRVAANGTPGVLTNTLWTDTEAGALPDTCWADPDTATVTITPENGVVLSYGSTTPGTYEFAVTCKDSLGQETNTVTNTVIVQAPPTLPGDATTMGRSATDTSMRVVPTLAPNGEIKSTALDRLLLPPEITVELVDGVLTVVTNNAAPGDYEFEVTVTDNVGQTAKARFKVTVVEGPTASGGTATIPVDGSHTFDADPKPADNIDSVRVSDPPDQGSVTVDITGNVTFDGTGVEPGEYSFEVEWTDKLGQTCTSKYTVIVQAKPTLPGGATTMGRSGTDTSMKVVPTVGGDGSFTSELKTGDDWPSSMSVVLGSDGTLTVTTADTPPGTYTFEVEVTDDLGQKSGWATFTVTVVEGPTASGGTATIPVDGSHTFDADPQPADNIDSVRVSKAPDRGSVTVDITGNVTFDGTGVEPGEYTFKVEWTDKLGQTCTSDYTVIVQAKPTLPGGATTMGRSGTDTSMKVVPTVGGDGSFTSELKTGDGWPSSMSVVLGSDGTLTVTTADTTPGTYTFEVEVFDDLGQKSAPATFTVTVVEGPVIIDPDGTGAKARIPEGGEHTFELDIESKRPITQAVVGENAPEGAVTASTDGTVHFDAGELDPGEYTFDVTFIDDLNQSVTVEVTVIVQAKPTLPGDETTMGVTASDKSMKVLATADTKAGGSINSEKTELRKGDDWPSSMSVALGPDGTLTVTTADTPPGTYTFDVEVFDDLGQTAKATFTVKVANGPGWNDLTGEDAEATIPEGGSHTFHLTIESDVPLKDEVIVKGVGDAPVAAVTAVDKDGTVHFDASGRDPGVYEYDVTFTDELDQSVTVRVKVTVQAKPTLPGDETEMGVSASDKSMKVVPVTTGEITDIQLDASGWPPEITVELGADGVLTVVTNGADPGEYTFTVTVTDDLDQTGEATFTVTVFAGPFVDDPTGEGASAKVPEGGQHTFELDIETKRDIEKAEVEGVDGAPVTAVTTVDPDGTVHFEAGDLPPGVYEYDVTFTDDLGQWVKVRVKVTIQAKPTLPGDEIEMGVSARDDTMRVSPVTTGTIDSIAINRLTLPPELTVELVDGVLTVVTNGADPGEYEFTVTVTDDLKQTGEAVFKVKVFAGPVIDDPTGEGGSATIPEGGDHTFEFDIKTERDIESAEVKDAPDGATVTADTDGTVHFDAGDLPPGDYEFEVEFTDDLGQSVRVPVKVRVQAKPTLPGGSILMPTKSKEGNTELKVSPVTTGEIKKVELDESGLPETVKLVRDEETGQLTVSTIDAPPGEYSFKVRVTDDLGQLSDWATFTVKVRSLEVTGEPKSECLTLGNTSHYPVVNHPEHVVSVRFLELPMQGTVSYDPKTGEVRYVAGFRAGVYHYVMEWTDDLGQTAILRHTVTVRPVDETTPPVSPTPTTPTPKPTTPSPDPTDTGDDKKKTVGTGGTVTGGGLPGAAVTALGLAGITILLGAAFLLARRRDGEDVGR